MAGPDEPLFVTETPLGFRVRVGRRRWDHIATVKHTVMAGRESDVAETLANPDEVRLSQSDPSVYLFYRVDGDRRWVCAVSKRLVDDGFLITVYPTDAVKEGELVWPL